MTVSITVHGEKFPPCTDITGEKCGEPVSISGQNINCGISEGVFLHGSRTGNRIALTFDLCPTNHIPAFTPEVVDYLEREHVPTTFFVSGLWAETNPEQFRRLLQVPFFEIALHGHHHHRLIDAKAETIHAEIEDGRVALQKLGVTPVPLFRPPYLHQPNSLAAVARQNEVLAVSGDVVLGDPDPNRTSEVMERDAIRWMQAGSIIVLHANGRGYGTSDAVRYLVPLMRQRGYIFDSVTNLISECRISAGAARIVYEYPHVVYE